MNKDNWNLKGKGISCGGFPSQTIEVFGEKTLYDDKIIETLRQKLIEDMKNWEVWSELEQYTSYELSEKGKREIINIINKRFGVNDNGKS